MLPGVQLLSARERATVESLAERARADARLQDHVRWRWLSWLRTESQRQGLTVAKG
jgi:hypothetical protein